MRETEIELLRKALTGTQDLRSRHFNVSLKIVLFKSFFFENVVGRQTLDAA